MPISNVVTLAISETQLRHILFGTIAAVLSFYVPGYFRSTLRFSGFDLAAVPLLMQPFKKRLIWSKAQGATLALLLARLVIAAKAPWGAFSLRVGRC